jgi:uncharacterized coiled-coil protein SlyX
MDEDIYNTAGEYYNPDPVTNRREDGRLRQVIERLRDEDKRQNERIKQLEAGMKAMEVQVQDLWQSHNRIEVALIGHNGENGIRRTMMDHYKSSVTRLGNLESRINDQNSTLIELSKNLNTMDTSLKTIAKIFGSVSALVGTVATIFAIISYL